MSFHELQKASLDFIRFYKENQAVSLQTGTMRNNLSIIGLVQINDFNLNVISIKTTIF